MIATGEIFNSLDGKKGFVLGITVLAIALIDLIFPSWNLLPDDKNLWDVHVIQAIFFLFLAVIKSDLKSIAKDKTIANLVKNGDGK